jgi:hypothetical protein
MSGWRQKYDSVLHEEADLSEADFSSTRRINASVSNQSKSSYAIFAASHKPLRKYPVDDEVEYETKTFQMILFRLLPIGTVISWSVEIGGLMYCWLVVDKREVYKWFVSLYPFLKNDCTTVILELVFFRQVPRSRTLHLGRRSSVCFTPTTFLSLQYH